MVIRSEMQAKMLRYNIEQNKFIGQTSANLQILHIHYNQMFVASSKTVHNPWFRLIHYTRNTYLTTVLVT